MAASSSKIALVTGGTSGIGHAVAEGLARKGVGVVLLARDRGRAETSAEAIRKAVPGANVEILLGDLASLATIRSAAAEFVKIHPRLDILVLAAGVFHKTRQETVDGFEQTFQVNYLGHFLLVQLLASALRAGSPSRVVFVASRYGNAHLDFDDLQLKQRPFTVLGSVAPTKLAEVLLAQELSERWASAGVHVNAIHPGLVAHTHLLEEVGGFWKAITNLFGGSPEKGADTVIWLATDPEAATLTGKFWSRRRPLKTPGEGSDPTVRRRLWDVSLTLCGLPGSDATS